MKHGPIPVRGLAPIPGMRTPSLSLWSLPSSFAQKQNEQNPMEKNSILWESKLYVKLAVYSIAITSITLFRFPESAYKYGGSLVAAYILFMALVIQPIVYMELLLGQMYLRKLPIRSDYCIYRFAADGLRIATAMMVFLFIPSQSIGSLYSATLMDYSSLAGSISKSPESPRLLPWCSCLYLADAEVKRDDYNATQFPFESGNSPVSIGQSQFNCVDQQDYASFLETNLFGQILSPSDFEAQIAPILYLKKEADVAAWKGSTDKKYNNMLNVIHWKLILSGIISTGLIFFFKMKQRFQPFLLKSILWITVLFPALIIIMLIFQLNKTGRVSTMLELISIDCSHFKDLQMWTEVFRLAMLTSGVGLGLHTTISSTTRMSYKKYYQISWMFVLFTVMSALTLTLLFFSEIEYFTILTGAEIPQEAVPTKMPGISVILLATIFCKLNSAIGMKALYSLFYVIKLVVFCRIQILAFETIGRTLNTSKWFGREKKLFKLLLKCTILICMQVFLNLQYILKLTQELYSASNFDLLSGTWTILLFLVFQIFHFSGKNYPDTFEKDLYLSYRLKLSKIFRFQLRSYSVFILLLPAVALLSFEMVQKLLEFANRKSAINFREDWTFLYGMALNLLPFLMFLLGMCWQLIKNYTKNNRHHDRTAEGKKIKKLITQSSGRHAHYPWSKEIISLTDEKMLFNFGSQRDDWTATVWPPGLRRPQLDLATVAKSLAPQDDDPAELSDSYQPSLQNSLEYLNLQSRIPLSSFRDPNPKRKPPRHRVVRQIRHRRPPLPPEWSPGGLGDFSLYNAHLNGKPPGPDSTSLQSLPTTGSDFYAIPTPLILAQNLTTQAPMAMNECITDVIPSENEFQKDCCLPPPPKFLLLECHQAQLLEQENVVEQIQLQHVHLQQQTVPVPASAQVFSSLLIPPPPPLPISASPDSTVIDTHNNNNSDLNNTNESGDTDTGSEMGKCKSNGNANDQDEDYENVISTIHELDQVLALASASSSPESAASEITQGDTDTTKAMNDIIDYLTPRLAKELNISFGSTSTEEDLSYSFTYNTLGDGSSACHSFLYDKRLS